jgi:hypothetical protein
MGRWWAPGDLLILVAVIALSAFLISASLAGAEGASGLEVVVTVNGREVLSRPLGNGDQRLTVRGYQGESLIEISGGRVRMVDSACPDKLCARTGWISRPHESIVCLPNRVVIELRSGEGGPDAVNR